MNGKLEVIATLAHIGLLEVQSPIHSDFRSKHFLY